MKEAIQKAIEGGWKDNRRVSTILFSHLEVDAIALLDPLFWQALGRALGWEEIKPFKVQDNGIGYSPRFSAVPNDQPQRDWRKEWHRFIDHLADGNDPESFFKDLLASHQEK